MPLRAYAKLMRQKPMNRLSSATSWTASTSTPRESVAFNIAEGWSRDVTESIAQAVLERGRNHFSKAAKEFVERTLDEIVE